MPSAASSEKCGHGLTRVESAGNVAAASVRAEEGRRGEEKVAVRCSCVVIVEIAAGEGEEEGEGEAGAVELAPPLL